jgi:hypothetical protein
MRRLAITLADQDLGELDGAARNNVGTRSDHFLEFSLGLVRSATSDRFQDLSSHLGLT